MRGGAVRGLTRVGPCSQVGHLRLPAAPPPVPLLDRSGKLGARLTHDQHCSSGTCRAFSAYAPDVPAWSRRTTGAVETSGPSRIRARAPGSDLDRSSSSSGFGRVPGSEDDHGPGNLAGFHRREGVVDLLELD